MYNYVFKKIFFKENYTMSLDKPFIPCVILFINSFSAHSLRIPVILKGTIYIIDLLRFENKFTTLRQRNQTHPDCVYSCMTEATL